MPKKFSILNVTDRNTETIGSNYLLTKHLTEGSKSDKMLICKKQKKNIYVQYFQHFLQANEGFTYEKFRPLRNEIKEY